MRPTSERWEQIQRSIHCDTDHSRLSKRYPQWRINWNFHQDGRFTMCFMHRSFPHTWRRKRMAQTFYDPHLTLLKERKNSRWNASSIIGTGGGAKHCNISSNGRAILIVITLGNRHQMCMRHSL